MLWMWRSVRGLIGLGWKIVDQWLWNASATSCGEFTCLLLMFRYSNVLLGVPFSLKMLFQKSEGEVFLCCSVSLIRCVQCFMWSSCRLLIRWFFIMVRSQCICGMLLRFC